MQKITGAWLTVNRFCNFRCRWCYAKDCKFKNADDMNLDVAERIVRFLAKLGIQEIIYIGGEPTFWKHLFKVDQLVHKLGMRSAIVTNGYLFHHPHWLARFKESEIDYINISLKAGNAVQHKKLTGTPDGTFELVLRGIQNALATGREVNVSTVVNTLVLDNLAEIVDVATACGVSEVFLQLCTPEFIRGQPQKGLMVPPAEIARVIGENYTRMNEATKGGLVIEGTIPSCVWDPLLLKTLKEREQLSMGCQLVTRQGLVFTQTGALIPCNHLFDFPIGQLGVDFDSPETFETFWESSAILEMHRQLTAYPTMECIPCLMHPECGGGCPLQWFVYDPQKTVKGVS